MRSSTIDRPNVSHKNTAVQYLQKISALKFLLTIEQRKLEHEKQTEVTLAAKNDKFDKEKAALLEKVDRILREEEDQYQQLLEASIPSPSQSPRSRKDIVQEQIHSPLC